MDRLAPSSRFTFFVLDAVAGWQIVSADLDLFSLSAMIKDFAHKYVVAIAVSGTTPAHLPVLDQSQLRHDYSLWYAEEGHTSYRVIGAVSLGDLGEALVDALVYLEAEAIFIVPPDHHGPATP